MRQLTTLNLKPIICNRSQDGLEYGSTRTKTRLPLIAVISIRRRILETCVVCLHDEGVMLVLPNEKSGNHWRLHPIWYSEFCMLTNNPGPRIPLPFSNWMFAGIGYIFYYQGDFPENINIKRNITIVTVVSWDSLLSSHDFMRNWVSGKKLLTMFLLKTCQTHAAIISTIIH